MSRRSQVVALLATAWLIAGLAPAGTQASATERMKRAGRLTEMDNPDRIPGSFIVQLAKGVDVGAASRKLAAKNGGRVTYRFEHVVGGFEFTGPDSAAAALAADPLVKRVEADRKAWLADAVVGRTTAAVRRTHANRPGAPADSAKESGYDGTGVAGAIIDSGVDYQHQEFDSPNKFVDVDPSDVDVDAGLCDKTGYHAGPGLAAGNDTNGHGTRGAGNFAGEGDATGGIEGIAPKANIAVMKVRLTVGGAICGINAVAGWNGDIYPANDIQLVNISLVWGDRNASSEACGANLAHQAICNLAISLPPFGVFITAAAGNNGKDVKDFAPGGYAEAFGVSAMCDVYQGPTSEGESNPDGDTHPDGRASFSNFGPDVDAMAPGCRIDSPTAGANNNDYSSSASGTSRSAPFALGVAALVKQAWGPGITSTNIRNALITTGECTNGAAVVGAKCAVAWPRIDLSTYTKTLPTPAVAAEPFVRADRAVVCAAAHCV